MYIYIIHNVMRGVTKISIGYWPSTHLKYTISEQKDEE